MPVLIKKPKDARYDLPLQEHYRHVDFNGVDLSYADFRGANLSDCKFKECVLFHSNFKGSEMNEGTKITHNDMRSPLKAKAHFTENQKQMLGLVGTGKER